MRETIASPRPFFENVVSKKGEEIAVLGGSTAGVVVKVTKRGLHLNGYYASFSNPDVRFGTMRKFAFISWEDLDRMKQTVMSKGKKKGQPDGIDSPSKEYLDTLPQVEMNGMLFYMDMENRVYRPVKTPSHIFYFKKVLENDSNKSEAGDGSEAN